MSKELDDLFNEAIFKHKVFDIYVKIIDYGYKTRGKNGGEEDLIVVYRSLDSFEIKIEKADDFCPRFEKVGKSVHTEAEIKKYASEWVKIS